MKTLTSVTRHDDEGATPTAFDCLFFSTGAGRDVLQQRPNVRALARTTMTPRLWIRETTRNEHARVDRLFSRFDLAETAGYRSLLAAHATAHLAIEAALDAAGASAIVDDWDKRRRADLLRADLLDLGVSAALAPDPAPRFRSDAEVLGGVYVIEGSRLGGTILAGRLPAGAPRRFLTAPGAVGAWRKLQALLDDRLQDKPMLGAAVEAARSCFRAFEFAGQRELELMLG